MRGGIKVLFGGLFVFVFLVLPLASAYSGLGLAWNKESALVPENTKTCLTYNVYNPFDQSTYAKIQLSDQMKQILTSSQSEVKLIPNNTPSTAGIPVKICFKTPRVYPKDCLVGNSLLCKQTCTEPMKVYQGEVEAVQVSEAQFKSGGSGGSMTQMSISAPIRVRVECIPHARDYTVVYALVAIIATILLVLNLRKSKNKKSNSKLKTGKSDEEREIKSSKAKSKKK
jgi:hypothetical protein